uniref:Uncharacterized protein n=1 Tax=Arundo donax TaxID=35708 RepID=A0A0A8Z849_ARUDO
MRSLKSLMWILQTKRLIFQSLRSGTMLIFQI